MPKIKYKVGDRFIDTDLYREDRVPMKVIEVRVESLSYVLRGFHGIVELTDYVDQEVLEKSYKKLD